MTKTLRNELRNLIGMASHLDGLLTEAGALPDMETAVALVGLARLNKQLDKIGARLEKAIPPEAKASA